MKKYLFLIAILISLVSYSQTPFPGGIRLVDADSITTSDTLALINKQKVLNKWVRGRDLPVKDVTINNYSHNGTLSSYLQGIDLALVLKADLADVNSHILNTNNPHSVTKVQVGLSNVDNTSDLDKPISTATQNALDDKASNSDLSLHTGDLANPHQVTKTQVGLSNVDNTSDIDKPISTATQAALDLKANSSDVYTKTESDNRYVNVTGDTMTGNLTATNFIGNGSGLTNVNAVSLGGQPASYYNFRNYGLGTQTIVSTNWDLISETGFYTGVYNVTTGMPINAGEMSLLHIQTSANSFTQTCIRVSTGETWVRNQFSGTLGNWQKVFITSLSNTITGTTLYNKTIAEQASANNKTVVNREFVEDYVASNSGLPVGFYEEGTFTPTLVDQGGGATYSFTINKAEYIRTGNNVMINIILSNINTSGTPSGSFYITNLPEPVAIGSGGAVTIGTFLGSDLTSTELDRLTSYFLAGNRIYFGGFQNNFTIKISFTSGQLDITANYKTNVYTP